jgi:hypothetical protein
MPEPHEIHRRIDAPPSHPRARLVRVLAALALTAGCVLLGGFIGYGVGEGTCHDDPDEVLACLGNDLVGIVIGSVAGLVFGVVLSVRLVRALQRRG